MRASRPVLYLLILLVATVLVMVAVLRPTVFPGLVESEPVEVEEETPEVAPKVTPPDTGPRLYLVRDDAGQALAHLAGC